VGGGGGVSFVCVCVCVCTDLFDQPVTDAQINALLMVAQTPTVPDTLRAKCVGTLGVLARRSPGYVEMNRVSRHNRTMLCMLTTWSRHLCAIIPYLSLGYWYNVDATCG
jgi:hypothetical protein